MVPPVVRHRTLFLRCLCEARGATAIEYSVMAAGIALAVAGAIRVLGATVLNNLFSQLGGLFGRSALSCALIGRQLRLHLYKGPLSFARVLGGALTGSRQSRSTEYSSFPKRG